MLIRLVDKIFNTWAQEKKLEPIRKTLGTVEASRNPLRATGSRANGPELFETWFAARSLTAEANFRKGVEFVLFKAFRTAYRTTDRGFKGECSHCGMDIRRYVKRGTRVGMC